MKFVLAPDSFKESCSAQEVCAAMEKGIRRVFPTAEVISIPMADGGEGTTHALVNATHGHLIQTEVTDPLGNRIIAEVGLLGDGSTAVIEMASASGLYLVPREKRNPFETSTFGTGELIKACLDKGVKRIVLGIGGSATNDGGTGMAKALGVKFLDQAGAEIPEGGGYLHLLESIDVSNIHPGLADCQITIASDVSNPLYGKNGASAVFGPQKGADAAMVEKLDANLRHYDTVLNRKFGKKVGEIPGSGAAGGLGAGLLAFTHCHMENGVDVVMEYAQLKEKLAGADCCFTGEGQMDFQTKFGKTPYGVMKAAKEVNAAMKVVAIAGSLGEDIEELYSAGFDGLFSIIPKPSTLKELLEKGPANITRTTESICRLLK